MTQPTTELLATGGDAQTIVDTATRATNPRPLDGNGRFYSLVVPAGGQVQVIDLEKHLEQFRDRPRRKTGTYSVHDAASFIAYMAKHALPETEVWADASGAGLVAVINAHLGQTGDGIEDYAGWGDHRLVLNLKATDAWKAWTEYDGKLLDQNTFAEHIETRVIDIVRPTGADMLELAQTFQATIGVSFESSKLLSSGQRQLEYRESVDAKAGRRGQLEIPKDFEIGLSPFDGAPGYKVTARFRYRITDGVLRVGYRLDRPADVLREAFLDVINHVADNITAPVYRGTSQ